MVGGGNESQDSGDISGAGVCRGSVRPRRQSSRNRSDRKSDCGHRVRKNRRWKNRGRKTGAGDGLHFSRWKKQRRNSCESNRFGGGAKSRDSREFKKRRANR